MGISSQVQNENDLLIPFCYKTIVFILLQTTSNHNIQFFSQQPMLFIL
jgi:hypothetical protein